VIGHPDRQPAVDRQDAAEITEAARSCVRRRPRHCEPALSGQSEQLKAEVAKFLATVRQAA